MAKIAPAATARKASAKRLLRCTPLGWKINDPGLQEIFKAQYPEWCSAPAKIYSAYWILLPIYTMSGFLGYPLGIAFFLWLVPVALAIPLYISCSLNVTKPYVEELLTIAVSLLVV